MTDPRSDARYRQLWEVLDPNEGKTVKELTVMTYNNPHAVAYVRARLGTLASHGLAKNLSPPSKRGHAWVRRGSLSDLDAFQRGSRYD